LAGFQGTERFTLCRSLGSGGFGEVFEAYDHVRQHKVALKVPHEASPRTIFLVKQEFRTMADVAHPNLVNLFELHTQGADWFFTMELVEGSNFYRRLRGEPRGEEGGGSRGPGPEPPTLGSGPDATQAGAPFAHPGADGVTQAAPPEGAVGLGPFLNAGPVDPPHPGTGSAPRDYREVRDLTRQLAEGLEALHAAGKLHRDIKPANVLVTNQGRVVLVDFGLAMDLGPVSRAGARPTRLGGTPAYMAPERMAGRPPTAASDWYSVGVMLYRVLTGMLPFADRDPAGSQGRPGQGPPLAPGGAAVARAPAEVVPGTPQDLSQLCLDLLAQDPALRPAGREVLRRLSGPPANALDRAGLLPVPRFAADAPMVGRDAELARLRQAFAASRRGQPVLVLAHGASGMGKSFLLRGFRSELEQTLPAAVLLSGRCYEQERVPHKAVDSLVDALCQYLLGLPRNRLAGLLPENMACLARLFPVLSQLQGVGAGRTALRGGQGAQDTQDTQDIQDIQDIQDVQDVQDVQDALDPQDYRRKAFSALRRLLRNLGEAAPLVLFLDDLQWGDRDSSILLASLFHAPEAPAMLVLACHRTEHGRTSPVIGAFRDQLADVPTEVVDLEVKALPGPEARALALALLPGGAEARDRAVWIARESGGSPFFITEMARQTGIWPAPPGAPPAWPQTLAQYLKARVDGLSEAGRRVLEVLALAGQPVEVELLARICAQGLPQTELLTRLRAEHFIRVRGLGGNQVEVFHDRIRDAVARDIPDARARDLHLQLALAMEPAPVPDLQALARHFHLAGVLDKAAAFAELAADQAGRALAFDQAAHFFRMALALHAPGAAGRPGLLIRLGQVLADAGLGAEAAQAYQEAAVLSAGHAAIRLRRMTAEQSFRCGRFDQGTATLKEVLAALGMKPPASPRWALVAWLCRRALLRLRGLRFTLRREADLDPAMLERIDACWTGAMGLGPIDHIRGGELQARGLALALKAGEPGRLVRALAHETVYAAHRGNRSVAAARRVLAVTQALAQQMGTPGARSRACLAAGIAALMQGRWKDAAELHDQAEALIRAHGAGMDYELHITQHHGLVSHWVLGHVPLVRARLDSCLQTVRDKADLLALTNLRAGVAPYLHLAWDQPGQARREIQQAMAQWSAAGFHIQHYNALVAQVNVLLYEGAVPEAWALLKDRWPALQASMLLRVQGMFITMTELRARTALALAATLAAGSPVRKACLESAQADRRALAGEHIRYGAAMVCCLRAQEALVQGRPGPAAELLDRAEADFAACHMGLHRRTAHLIRRRLEAGPEAEVQAGEDLRALGILRPDRYARMLVPLPESLMGESAAG
jgi:serine/threonine protein kinase/tetratricopeptide (TPR) repeat protein